MSQGSGSMQEDKSMSEIDSQSRSGTQVRFTTVVLKDSSQPSSDQPSPARVRGKAARRTPFSQESQSSKTTSITSPSASITSTGSRGGNSLKRKRKEFQKPGGSSGSNTKTQLREKTENPNYATQQWPTQLVSFDVEDHGGDEDQEAVDQEAVLDENTAELFGSDLQDDILEELVDDSQPLATSPIVKLPSSNDSASSEKSSTSRIDSSEPTTLSQIQPGQRLPSVSQSMVAYEASQSLELQSELSQDQCYSDLESPGLLMELDEGPSHHNPTEDEYEKLEASRQRLALLYQLDQLMVYPHNYGQDPGEDGVSEAESDHDLESEWEGISPELELGGEQDVSVQVDGDESPQVMETEISPKKRVTLRPSTTTNTSESAIQASPTQNKRQERPRISHLSESSAEASHGTSTWSSHLNSDDSTPENITEVVRRSTVLPMTVVRSSQGSSSGTTDYSQERHAPVVRPAAAPAPSKKLSTGQDSIPKILTASKTPRNTKETLVYIEIPPVSERIRLKRLDEARMARNHAEATSPSAVTLRPGNSLADNPSSLGRSARSVTPPVPITQTPENRRHSAGQPPKRKLNSESNGEAHHPVQVDVNPDNYRRDQGISKMPTGAKIFRWSDGGPDFDNQHEVSADSPSRSLRQYSDVIPSQVHDRSGDLSWRDSPQPRRSDLRSVSFDHSHSQGEDGPEYDSPMSYGGEQRAPIHRARGMGKPYARRTGLPMSGARKLGTSSYGSKLLQKTASSSSEWEGTSFDYQSEDHDDVDGMETNDVVEGGGRVEEDLGNMAIHQDGLDEPKATPNNEVRHLRKRPRRMIVSESVTPERAMNELNDRKDTFTVQKNPQERTSATPTFSSTTANASNGHETWSDKSSEEVERLRVIWRDHGLRWPFWTGDEAFQAEAYSAGYVFGTALPLPKTAGK